MLGKCDDVLDWREVRWSCEREPDHYGPHRYSESGADARPFAIEWANSDVRSPAVDDAVT